jgi:hypothetical protein
MRDSRRRRGREGRDGATVSNYDDDRQRTRFYDDDGTTELAYGTPYELAVQVHQLRGALDAERAKAKDLEEAAEAMVKAIGGYADAVLGTSQLDAAGRPVRVKAFEKFQAARARWLAAKEAPATPAPAPLDDDRGEG